MGPTLFRNRRCHLCRLVGKRVGVAEPQEETERVPFVALPPGQISRTSHLDCSVLSAEPPGPAATEGFHGMPTASVGMAPGRLPKDRIK